MVNDNYSIRDYGAMIEDQRRTGSYVEALRRAIRPGDVVLDIGTGSGIFAFLACRFGASRVYAIEPDDAIEVAKLCADDNADSSRITWLRGVSTEIDLPERVDVVVGDLHGVMPFYNTNIPSLVDARRRHLKPDGILIPGRDLLRAVPAHAPQEYRRITSPWEQNDYDVDLRGAQRFMRNNWWRAKDASVAPERLLANAADWGVIDYRTVETSDLRGDLEWIVERSAEMHGFYVWFDSDLGNDVGLSNTPVLEAMVYGRGFFPLEQPVDVAVGDRIRLRLLAKCIDGSEFYRWDTAIVSAAGDVRANYHQHTLGASPLDLGAIKRASPGHVPVLNDDGQMALEILQAMARSQPMGEIATDLAARYPVRLAEPAQAYERVVELAKRFCS